MNKTFIFSFLIMGNSLFSMSLQHLINVSDDIPPLKTNETEQIHPKCLSAFTPKDEKQVTTASILDKSEFPAFTSLKPKVPCTVPDCAKLYVNVLVMRRHREFFHRICYSCEQSFNDYETLQDHLKTHKRYIEYQVKCSQCNFITISEQPGYAKKKLTRHETEFHTDNEAVHKKHPCTVKDCKKSYNSKQNVLKHQEFIHHICRQCNQALDDYQSLLTHQKEHDNHSIKYECNQPHCIKSYKNKCSLNKHYEFDHKICLICKKCYQDLSSLQKHNQEHEKKIIYQLACQLCDFIAINRKGDAQSKLAKHMQKIHNSIPNH